MKVGVIQSNYVPWRGYFDFIASVDLFVLYDDVQYTKNDWRNRNKFRFTSGDTKWVTVPVQPGRFGKLVNETLVDSTSNWRTAHLNSFKENYKRAPHFDEAYKLYESCLSFESEFLSQINENAIRKICAHLGIATQIVRSEPYALTGSKNDRLLDLLHKVGATTYLSGPSAESYLDKSLFRSHGIELEFKSYDYLSYPQIHGKFDGAVSVLDLIANTGREARGFLQTTQADRKVA